MTAIASTRITPAAKVTAGLYSPKTAVTVGAGGAACSLMTGPLCAHRRALFNLELHAGAELDDAIVRDMKERAHVAGVARHRGEEPSAPHSSSALGTSGRF